MIFRLCLIRAPAAYFTQGTIEFLRTADQIPELANVIPPPGTYRSARATGSKKNQEPISTPLPEYAMPHGAEVPPIRWPPYPPGPPCAPMEASPYHSPEPHRHLPPLSPVEMRPPSVSHYGPSTPSSLRSSISPFTRNLPLPVRTSTSNAALEDVYLPPLSVSPYPYARRDAVDDKQLDLLLRRFMLPGSHANPSPNQQ